MLARLPDAPPGTRGISLFLVPKFLVNADGSLGARNDVRAHSIEHKLGIHASPTCTMVFGDQGGAIGYLIGEENRGMACMFTMMNQARLVGRRCRASRIAERATQQALAYARERKQGRAVGGRPGIEPDHRASRRAAHAADHAGADARRARDLLRDRGRASTALSARRRRQARRPPHERASLLTPVAKAFATDIGIEVASLGVQVHGGMGYIEETGAAQHYRDARIAAIYEGTNGIQAIDLVTRKLPLAGGATVQTLSRRSAPDRGDGQRRPTIRPSARPAPRLGEAVDSARARHRLAPRRGRHDRRGARRRDALSAAVRDRGRRRAPGRGGAGGGPRLGDRARGAHRARAVLCRASCVAGRRTRARR